MHLLAARPANTAASDLIQYVAKAALARLALCASRRFVGEPRVGARRIKDGTNLNIIRILVEPLSGWPAGFHTKRLLPPPPSTDQRPAAECPLFLAQSSAKQKQELLLLLAAAN